MPTDSDSPDNETSPESIEDLRSVLAGLEDEMVTLESSLSELGESPEETVPSDTSLEDLEDVSNHTRMASHRMLPREAPAPLYEELGEEESDAIPNARVVFDLNPKPNPDQVRPKREPKVQKAKDDPKKVARPSKRERKRQERDEKARTRAVEREKSRPQSSDPNREGGIVEKPIQRRMDELDLENPLPEATFAPNRDHSDLVMDRRQRRLESAAIAQITECARDEVWDQSELPDADGLGKSERPFNLPVYLAKAVLVSIAGLLIVMGARTAYKSMRDAKDGEEELARSEIPNLRALGLIEATEVVQSYFAADGWEKKLEFVRQPDLARPRMQRFYQTHPGEDQAVAGVEIIEPRYNGLEGGGGFLFQCRFPNGEGESVAAVRITSEAPYFVVDWEVLVDYAEVGWDAFIKAKKPGSRGIFRVWALEDHSFSDGQEFLAVKLYSRQRQTEAYGYAEQGSDASRDIRQYLELSKQRGLASERQQGGSSYLLEHTLMADSDNPQGILDAMRAIRALDDVQPKQDDLFGDKNFIKPELWQRPKEFWAGMTIEVVFREEGANPNLPQLQILRCLGPNWVLGETRMELDTEAPSPGNLNP